MSEDNNKKEEMTQIIGLTCPNCRYIMSRHFNEGPLIYDILEESADGYMERVECPNCKQIGPLSKWEYQKREYDASSSQQQEFGKEK
jgi:phage FluMu protein Com